jgi:hypothetical protein
MSVTICNPMLHHPSGRPARGSLFRHALQLLGLPDPRGSERTECCLPVVYQTVTVHVPDRGLARVVDLSPEGAGLRTRRVVDPGEFIVIRPEIPCAGWLPLLLRVTHRSLLPSGEYHWGGPWLQRLSLDQLAGMFPGAATLP